jgi:hypothetical protein
MLQLKSLNNRLFELKLAFDEAIMQGNSFAEVKKIYTEIKELEKQIAECQVDLLKAGRLED